MKKEYGKIYTAGNRVSVELTDGKQECFHFKNFEAAYGFVMQKCNDKIDLIAVSKTKEAEEPKSEEKTAKKKAKDKDAKAAE